MLKGLWRISFLLCLGFNAFAQTTIPLSADLAQAPKITFNKKYTFPESPRGYGKIKEFPLNPKRSSILFKEERNTAWFRIEAPLDGVITFEISPHKFSDDYDWMLFEDTAGFAAEIQDDVAKPVRSNNARNDERIGGKTGLKEGFDNFFEVPGPGKSYSKPLNVKRGEKYLLLIDNIYEGGKGFDLEVFFKFDSLRTTLLRGTVTDRLTEKPLKASLTIEDDSTGIVISRFDTDDTGRYDMHIPSGSVLQIVAEHPDYLFQTSYIKAISKQENVLDFALDKPAAGSKLVLFNIHFLPNKAEILATSEADIRRLVNFLTLHPQWSAKIVGHTHNNVFASERYLQQLSFNRAVAVKNVLLKNGIAERRLSCIGMGGKHPLSDSKDLLESLKNMRVEIILR